ncbi:hypothetical protein AVEN_75829-1 [Araneus ventricosus]|uniref:Uncharacterized protein n=1 Tax=Araneus ventricosus TaxID=182803 RepID=A0A4Y2PRZ2_ARAVE|nr:hypothetical protein AVEN_75829-1 [Araneus ventricosus]
MDDAPRSGRPSTSVTTDNIERVRQMLLQNRRLSLRWISEELGINKDNVSVIIHKDLDVRPCRTVDEVEQLRRNPTYSRGKSIMCRVKEPPTLLPNPQVCSEVRGLQTRQSSRQSPS